MGDPEACVERELAGAIEPSRRGRQHLAYRVGSDGDESLAGRCRHALASPAGDVRNDNVRGQMQLGFVQDPPAARAAVAELHARDERGAERRRTHRMGHGWSRADDQFAVYDLAHEVLGQSEDVLVGSGARRRLRHAKKVARTMPAGGTAP